MSSQAQILAGVVSDLLHYSNMPSLRHQGIPAFHSRAGGRRGAEDVIMQNKANSGMAPQRLTAGQEKGYVRRYERCVCENKANLPGRACTVPAHKGIGRDARFCVSTAHYEQACAQNKANLQGSKSTLTPAWEKGYEGFRSKRAVGKQSQFPAGRANAGRLGRKMRSQAGFGDNVFSLFIPHQVVGCARHTKTRPMGYKMVCRAHPNGFQHP